jgi:histidyl-tRNA synthetase
VKAQWKLADRARAAYGVMVGRDESERAAVAVKNLQTGEQIEVPREQVAGWIRARREAGHEASAGDAGAHP